MTYQISIDTGGTFTDAVIADETGIRTVGKALTNIEKNFVGVSNAIENAAEQLGLSLTETLAATDVFVYGTTRATNAIVTGRTARTAMLLTSGFPDILVYRQGGKTNPHQLNIDYPQPYIPRSLTFEISERTTAEGEIATPLDEGQVDAVLEKIKGCNVDAIAVCLLWSIANGDHERRIGELISQSMPEIPFSLSHELNPILREYPRASSTAIDASLKPIMQEQLKLLRQNLIDSGYSGDILVSTTLGGVLHVEDVIEKPIYLVKSGPSMGPVAGNTYANQEDLGNNALVVDTGGTTFDVSLVRNNQIAQSSESWLGPIYTGHLLGMAAVDVRSIGAGGGSIAWLDSGGLLHVGPQSAGAQPGPACYGQGGKQPTVTDAAMVLGYLNPEHFLGGRMGLDQQAAVNVLKPIASALDRSVEDAALAVLTVADENMIKAIQEITVKEGINPAETVIVAGGGAAGLNILPIAKSLGVRRVLMPSTAGALSACGGYFSDIVSEVKQSHFTLTDAFDFDGVNRRLEQLTARLDDFADRLQARGLNDFDRQLSVEARYAGQIWEIEIPLRSDRFANDTDVERLVDDFHTEHERIFAVRDTENPLECINWKGRIAAVRPSALGRPVAAGDVAEITPQSTRVASFGDIRAEALETKIYFGESLQPNALIHGPAIIEEATSTLVIYPDMSVRVTPNGHYLAELSHDK
ncbi:MAG: hydantoinase/oxoprolinase family protein [Gammaproteobacteria bacterium]